MARSWLAVAVVAAVLGVAAGQRGSGGRPGGKPGGGAVKRTPTRSPTERPTLAPSPMPSSRPSSTPTSAPTQGHQSGDGCPGGRWGSTGFDQQCFDDQLGSAAMGGLRCCYEEDDAAASGGGAAATTKCASKDSSNQCYPPFESFPQAEAACQADGRRLCTVAELESRLCCNTGCYYNHQRTWASQTCAAAPLVAAGSSHQSVDGCPGGAARNAFEPECLDDSLGSPALGGLRCCWQNSNGRTRCESQDLSNVCYPRYTTWQEANDICQADGRRLCTQAELESRVCCGTGCAYNHHRTWASDSCAASEAMTAADVAWADRLRWQEWQASQGLGMPTLLLLLAAAALAVGVLARWCLRAGDGKQAAVDEATPLLADSRQAAAAAERRV